ncbi:hypothetical protein [Pseudomonas rubra]|uniref:Tyr recombinase domain-containing protein n=1 Tax=Pseudomonas rubra TaxID=2942627 RepID=A0ABT5PCP6_9PSED|nr:hypothetical protein [Pseudomonas rubra]MDD1016080.1 hypothetical protein [Pseudomonas rubra]MDD1039997.1 hypothetical protein [Pseudomonas rubra]MDD1156296.1 hypothetical protein [Pseudomonas rubra]
MTASPTLGLSTAKRRKKSRDTDGILTVANSNRKSGFTDIDFSFLAHWPGVDQEAFWRGLQRFSRAYSAAGPTYAARKVLVFWMEFALKEGWSPPCKEMLPLTLVTQLAALRRSFYERGALAGRALSTSSNNWDMFLRLLKCLIDSKAIPFINLTLGSLASPDRKLILIHREEIIAQQHKMLTGPRNLNAEADSYNEQLLVPISIVTSNEKYLDEYRMNLREAISTIKLCALKDFSVLVASQTRGHVLIQKTNFDFLERLKTRGRWRYVDPANGLHYLDKKGGHPNLLGHLLAIVTEEMGGLPKPHRKFGSDGRTVESSSPYSYWYYVQSYGKNKILPYLGIMSSEAAVICALLLVIEHPKLNACSLYRAKLEDEHGRSILMTSAGENGEDIRLTVAKPRADEQKTVVLSKLGELVISKVLEWTRPLRDELRRQGRHDEAASLWIGMSSLNYDIVEFSDKAFTNGLGMNPAFRAHGQDANVTRRVPFIERHEELRPWSKKITFKALRVNSGVLRYLETDGDLAATARAFGHNNVATTIGHYIPPALRQLIYERQIRRHQNYLIVSSLNCDEIKLRASDFETVEELHSFLSGLAITSDRREYMDDAGQCTSNPEVETRSGTLIVADDPKALAVAMLYRDALTHASEVFLDSPDKRTGVTPRFWVEFIDALQSDLPPVMGEYTRLARAALTMKELMRGKVTLPEVQ